MTLSAPDARPPGPPAAPPGTSGDRRAPGPSRGRRPDPLLPTLVTGAVTLVLTAAGALLAGGAGAPLLAVPLLAAATVAADATATRLGVQGGPARGRASVPAVLALALALAPGVWTVPAVLLGAAAGRTRRHQPRRRRADDLARTGLSTAAAAVLAVAVPGPGGVALALTACWLLDHVLTGAAVARSSPQRLSSLLRSGAARSAARTAGAAALGLLTAHLCRSAPWELLGLLGPLALLRSAAEQQDRGRAEVRLFAELAAGEDVPSRSTDASVAVVLTAAARLFGGADVELVLLAADGPVRYVGDETGAPRRSRADPSVFDEPWVLRALAGPSGAAGTEHGRPWCSVALGRPDQPVAVLLARRGRGAAAFGREEARLARVLAGQAQQWLIPTEGRPPAPRGGGPELGDAGAGTSQALARLRDSAERLTRLPSGGSDVDLVVEELHTVERAVASLLGAVALAAQPDLLVPTRAPSTVPGRATTDWTSTGVLT